MDKLGFSFAPLILLLLLSYGIGLFILYYVIKSAVKSAIMESLSNTNLSSNIRIHLQDEIPNSKQSELTLAYEKGEITFEDYKKKWLLLR